VTDQFPIGSRRGHLVQEVPDLAGEFGAALGEEDVTDGSPSSFDVPSGIQKFGLAWLDPEVALQHC